MIYIPVSFIPFLIGMMLMVGLARLALWAIPKLTAFAIRQAKSSLYDQPVKPVNGLLARLNPLRLGQDATPATSLNTVLLHTTPGMRLWGLVTNIILNYFLWVHSRGVYLPDGLPSIALSLSAAIACIGLFLYEARVEDDRLIIRKWGLLHREYLWRDLTGIKEGGGQDYVLHFDKTEVRMPKYLVGAQGFLTFVSETLAGNHARNARTSRS